MYERLYLVSSATMGLTLSILFISSSVIIFTRLKSNFLDKQAKTLWVFFIFRFLICSSHALIYLTHLDEFMQNKYSQYWFNHLNTILYIIADMIVELIYYQFTYELFHVQIILDCLTCERFYKASDKLKRERRAVLITRLIGGLVILFNNIWVVTLGPNQASYEITIVFRIPILIADCYIII